MRKVVLSNMQFSR